MIATRRSNSSCRSWAFLGRFQTASQLVDGSLVLLPALVQDGIARQHRWTLGSAFPRRAIARWLPHPGVLMAPSYALSAVLYRLVPAPDGSPRPPLAIAGFVSIDVLLILGLAGYVHLTHPDVHHG